MFKYVVLHSHHHEFAIWPYSDPKSFPQNIVVLIIMVN